MNLRFTRRLSTTKSTLHGGQAVTRTTRWPLSYPVTAIKHVSWPGGPPEASGLVSGACPAPKTGFPEDLRFGAGTVRAPKPEASGGPGTNPGTKKTHFVPPCQKLWAGLVKKCLVLGTGWYPPISSIGWCIKPYIQSWSTC